MILLAGGHDWKSCSNSEAHLRDFRSPELRYLRKIVSSIALDTVTLQGHIPCNALLAAC